jgi:flagellar biosynthesis activator protein FlaF
LLKAARFLQDIQNNWETATREELDQALDYYRKLWVLLSTSVTSAENPLPDEIKQNVGNLAIFCIKRAMEVEFKPEAEKLTALISINKQIAAGLRGSSSDSEDAQASA